MGEAFSSVVNLGLKFAVFNVPPHTHTHTPKPSSD